MHLHSRLEPFALWFVMLLTGITAASGSAFAQAPAAERPRVLIVATSHADALNGKQTGLWLSELTDPYWVFRDAGMDVDIVTIQGGPSPIDPRSGSASSVAGKFRNQDASIGKFRNAPPIAAIAPGRYAAVFLAGGHGAMWDMPESAPLRALLEQMLRAGKPVGAVCHGPAGLLGVNGPDGKPVVAGRRITAFTDREESAAGWTEHIPYSLEQRLRQAGARFENAGVYSRHAVRDGLVVTGQNPASATAAAKLLADAVRAP